MTEKIEIETYDSNLTRLSELTTKAVQLGMDAGASQIEAVLTSGYDSSIEIKSNSIAGIQQQSKTSVTIRSYIGKQLGVASATSLTPNSVEEAVQNAIKLAKLSPADDNFQSLAAPMEREPAQVKGLFDEKIPLLDPSTVVENIGDLVQGASEIHEQANVNGKLNLNTTERVVGNSLGITSPMQTTSMTAYSYISIPLEPTNVGVGFEVLQSRKWDKTVDFFKLGQTGASKAEDMLGAKVAPSKKMPVVLDERATYQTLSQILGFGVNAYSVMTGRSYFADKIGAELAHEGISAWDDPHVDAGSGSRIYDMEGIPTTQVDIMTNGVLESYVTDSYTANKLGLKNTGNAGAGFRSKVPRPRVHQLQLAAGEDSIDELYEDLKEGIILESAVGPSGGSPDISSQINRGFYVEDGEIQYPLKNTMLGSNVFDFLKSITAISKELRKEFGHQSPAISVSEVSIAGAGDQKKRSPQGMSSI